MPASSHSAVRVVAAGALALVVLLAFRCAPHARQAPPPLLGTRHPISVTAIGPDHRWVVACQARRDTNGDGRIAVRRNADGSWAGDALQPYLFIAGIGEGIAIDAARARPCAAAPQVTIGVDDHHRVLRETVPRPDPSELPWGPLRWDEP